MELPGQRARSAKIVICHLGGGCSAAATQVNTAVATTFGFSPLDGLLMGPRSGSVDPGILLYLQRQHGLALSQLDHDLNYESGLLGLSGVSADLADIQAAAAQGHTRAAIAFAIFADHLRSAVAGLAATLGGLDALVFTDRIGEESPALRAAVCHSLKFMGVTLDSAKNQHAKADSDVAAAESRVRIFVLNTEEEWVVANEVRKVLGTPQRKPKN